MIRIADNNQILLDGEYTKYYFVQHPEKSTVYTILPYTEIDMPQDRYTASTPDGQAVLEHDIRALMAAPSYPTGVEAEVCAEIARRQAEGHRKYGTTVADADLTTAEWLQHLKEELLDAAIYAQRALRDVSPPLAPAPAPADESKAISQLLHHVARVVALVRVDSDGWQRLLERASADLADMADAINAGKRIAHTPGHMRNVTSIAIQRLADHARQMP